LPVYRPGGSKGFVWDERERGLPLCENTLAKGKAFRLPGRKAVAASARVLDTVLIDTPKHPSNAPLAIALVHGGRRAGEIDFSLVPGGGASQARAEEHDDALSQLDISERPSAHLSRLKKLPHHWRACARIIPSSGEWKVLKRGDADAEI
jgi:hypothetical protein